QMRAVEGRQPNAISSCFIMYDTPRVHPLGKNFKTSCDMIEDVTPIFMHFWTKATFIFGDFHVLWNKLDDISNLRAELCLMDACCLMEGPGIFAQITWGSLLENDKIVKPIFKFLK
ncbi:hypothetical protein ACJX0J_009855, partial [Zea mays]